MSQTVKKIYLHWSATPYNWAQPGHYHTIVLGNGTVRRMHGYDQPLRAHTFGRNQDAVGMCLACMGGTKEWEMPPTEAQIESLCKEVAQLAFQLGWKPDDINITRVLTHAEAAANRDYVNARDAVQRVSGWRFPSSTPQGNDYLRIARSLGLPHENYGPRQWQDGWPGGYVERWDLWQLKPSDPPGAGGNILRDKIKAYLIQMATPDQKMTAAVNNKANECKVFVNGTPISTGILLSDNRCYSKVGELAGALGMKVSWNARLRYINLLSEKYEPKFLADSPLIQGYPAVDVYLNRPELAGEPIDDTDQPARPFMQGIIINGSTHVIVGDFCKELGVQVAFQGSDRSLRITVPQ